MVGSLQANKVTHFSSLYYTIHSLTSNMCRPLCALGSWIPSAIIYPLDPIHKRYYSGRPEGFHVQTDWGLCRRGGGGFYRYHSDPWLQVGGL
jgi:hypothetical protein